jgi:uncharacterized membrane protein
MWLIWGLVYMFVANSEVAPMVTQQTWDVPCVLIIAVVVVFSASFGIVVTCLRRRRRAQCAALRGLENGLAY